MRNPKTKAVALKDGNNDVNGNEAKEKIDLLAQQNCDNNANKVVFSSSNL